MKLASAYIIAVTIMLSSCSTSRETSKFQLSDGYYKSKVFNSGNAAVYIDNEEDTISIYLVNRQSKNVDTSLVSKKVFPQSVSSIALQPNTFKQNSFDVDFLTIPFKYRPAQKDFPRQFNTNLNGAVYLGYRNDIYQLRYKKTPLQKFQRQTQHYGFSFGLFTGLGGTTMNPSVTNNQITTEYDGVVWSKGLAGIIGINNFTIGLALGYDNLLDANKKKWIYQGKPWIGLAFGLNLN